jgi:hypothetical protein
MGQWNDIRERLKKIHCKMKLHIKKMMCQLAFPEDTMLLSPPPRKVVTKGANKRVRSEGEKNTQEGGLNCVSIFDDLFFQVLNTTWIEYDVADSDSKSECSGILNTKIKDKESERERKQTQNNLYWFLL